MDFFFIAYRDPLFGVLILVAFVFIITLSHYFWTSFTKRAKSLKIKVFIDKFEEKAPALYGSLELEDLILLARSFALEGEFDKSKQLYLKLLAKCEQTELKEEIFLELAKVYLKAGFLEKAIEVLNSCLELRARNKKALLLLNYIYVKMALYEYALNTCLALEVLGEDIKEQLIYFKLLQSKLPQKEMKKIKKDDYIARFLYENRLYSIYPALKLCIDLLAELNTPINIEDKEYFEFFYSKNMLKAKNHFFKNTRLKMLKLLNDNDIKAKMAFFYHCKKCKSELAIFSYYCPNCYNFATVKISYEVKEDERN